MDTLPAPCVAVRAVVLGGGAGSAQRAPPRAAPPSHQQLRAAAALVGSVVDGTVRHVQPFGCFVEFAVALPEGGGTAALVGLVHRSEVAWEGAGPQLQELQVRWVGGGGRGQLPLLLPRAIAPWQCWLQ